MSPMTNWRWMSWLTPCFIVRNFWTVNGFMPRPRRRWRNRTGPGESSLIAAAISAITGSRSTRTMQATSRSTVRHAASPTTTFRSAGGATGSLTSMSVERGRAVIPIRFPLLVGRSYGLGSGRHTRAGMRERNRVEPDELLLQGAPAAVVQAMNGALGAADAVSDLARGQPDDVPEDDHLALLIRERRQCLANNLGPVEIRPGVRVGIDDVLGRRQPVATKVIDGDVAGEPQQPCEERHPAVVVLDDGGDQLCEDLLSDVLSLVIVANDRADV